MGARRRPVLRGRRVGIGYKLPYIDEKLKKDFDEILILIWIYLGTITVVSFVFYLGIWIMVMS